MASGVVLVIELIIGIVIFLLTTFILSYIITGYLSFDIGIGDATMVNYVVSAFDLLIKWSPVIFLGGIVSIIILLISGH